MHIGKLILPTCQGGWSQGSRLTRFATIHAHSQGLGLPTLLSIKLRTAGAGKGSGPVEQCQQDLQ